LVVDFFHTGYLLGFGADVGFLFVTLHRSAQRHRAVYRDDLYVLAIRRDRVVRYYSLADIL
jgi:DNA-binding transcriptional ArsR family regulator